MDSSQGQQAAQTRTQRVQEAASRLRPSANPLISRRKRPDARPRPSAAAARAPRPNGTGPTNGVNGLRPQQSSQSSQSTASQPMQIEEDYEDFPIITTKRALMDGLRHHVLRFLPNKSSDKQSIDLFDQSQFERPVRLHRRDPRADPLGSINNPGSPAENNAEAGGQPGDDKERARVAVLKAERQAEREANLAQMAPAAKSNKKKNNFRKQTEQVFQFNDSESKKKDMNIRYEEKLPWHVEDFENKNVWRGTYETALSECHIALLPNQSPNGAFFKMIPLEKWYKFTPKNKFKAMTIEEAEATMKKKYRDPRFLAEARHMAEMAKKQETERSIASKSLFARKGERGERPTAARVKTEEDDDAPEAPPDADEIDFNVEEDFADDEENELFNMDDNDEKKEIEGRIKKEQQEANTFEIKDDKDYDQEEEEEKRKAELQKKQKRRTQKALMKREKNFVYEEDSDGNPYSSSTDSEDSEAERPEEGKDHNDQTPSSQTKPDKRCPAAEKPSSSGHTTKGTSTPTGLPTKPSSADPLRKFLKRPGSPNLSEASGSESTRKKMKKKHPALVGNGGTSTPTISRPNSPLLGGQPQRMGSSLKLSLDPNKLGVEGSGSRKRKSTSAVNSGSEGEMYDGRKRVKKAAQATGMSGEAGLRPGSRNGSRPGSPRALSPASSAGGGTKPKPGQAKNGTAPQQQSPAQPPRSPPTGAEIRGAVPYEGMRFGHLVAKFPQLKEGKFKVDLIRENAVIDVLELKTKGAKTMVWPLERAAEMAEVAAKHKAEMEEKAHKVEEEKKAKVEGGPGAVDA